eukprot:TRINITY_DN266_c0_g1_i1.p1 TRINITY_DN266_c0_g1~~TRINITY_DN266_c0_g1_i1.p1  ORF type:complete len:874 (+),score=222.35 TRINITY_DN266_c0_g1_i1:57-2678(+)
MTARLSSFKGISKYKNTNGIDQKRENWFLDVNVSTSGDDNPIAASANWIAVAWSSVSAGPVAVLPLNSPTKVKDPPFLQGHSRKVTTLDFDPFDDNRLATGSEDNTIAIWNIPAGGLTGNLTEPTTVLKGHFGKLTGLRWSSTAGGVIASCSADKTVRVWDVATGAEKATAFVPGSVFSLDWNYNCSLIVCTTTEKKVVVVDARSGKVLQEGNSHEGVKPSLVAWLGDSNRFLTTGFNKARERQFFVWDASDLSKPLRQTNIDNGTGVLIPIFDGDTNQLYLAGKGDTTTRIYEILEGSDQQFQPATSKGVQSAVARVPKRALNILGCEINRLLRATPSEIIPCNFVVPRKVQMDFAEDIFPPTLGLTPALSANEWFSGTDKDPVLVSLNPANAGAVVQRTSSSSSIPAPKPATTTSSSSLSVTSNGSSSSSSSSPAPPRTSSSSGSTIGGKKSIVRSSKYRNVFVKYAHQSQFYTNMKVKLSMEGNPIQASNTHFAVPWLGAGGQLAVIPLTAVGRMADSINTVESGSDIMTFKFFPGSDTKVVTGIDNGKIRTWDVPEDLYKSGKNLTTPTGDIQAHNRRLNEVVFNPICNEVLLSTGMDHVVNIWDLNTMSNKISLDAHTEQIQSVTWNYYGNLFATSCKDTRLRIFDPRSRAVVGEAKNHEAPKATRVTWLGDSDSVFSVGFNKQSNREFMVWDIKRLDKPVTQVSLDQGNGVYEPFFDEDMNLLQLVAMGDTTIRNYEFERNGEGEVLPYYLVDCKVTGPTLGFAKLPKKSVDIKNVEVGSCLKISPQSNSHSIERISLRVPRTKVEYFQDDIYVDTRDTSSSVISSDDWFNGGKAEPKYAGLRPDDMPLWSSVSQAVPATRSSVSLQ